VAETEAAAEADGTGAGVGVGTGVAVGDGAAVPEIVPSQKREPSSVTRMPVGPSAVCQLSSSIQGAEPV